MYICVTYVDSITGLPADVAPMSNGPAFPDLKGFQYEWANEAEWPTDKPLFFGTCDADADTSINGVVEVLDQEKYERLRQGQTDMQSVKIRNQRNRLLVDYVDLINPIRWEMLDNDQKQELRDYRQALLDVPSQEGFPWKVQWPEKPSEPWKGEF